MIHRRLVSLMQFGRRAARFGFSAGLRRAEWALLCAETSKGSDATQSLRELLAPVQEICGEYHEAQSAGIHRKEFGYEWSGNGWLDANGQVLTRTATRDEYPIDNRLSRLGCATNVVPQYYDFLDLVQTLQWLGFQVHISRTHESLGLFFAKRRPVE